LYFSATFSVSLLLALLRFGPRLDDTARGMAHSHQNTYSAAGSLLPRAVEQAIAEDGLDPELQPLQTKLDPSMTTSFRTRASLGGIM
jgi:hypothetical protein